MRLGRRENEANPYHNKNGATGRCKILTLDDRVDVLKRIDNGESCRSIAAAVIVGRARSAEFVVTGRDSEEMGEWRQIRRFPSVDIKCFN